MPDDLAHLMEECLAWVSTATSGAPYSDSWGGWYTGELLVSERRLGEDCCDPGPVYSAPAAADRDPE